MEEENDFKFKWSISREPRFEALEFSAVYIWICLSSTLVRWTCWWTHIIMFFTIRVHMLCFYLQIIRLQSLKSLIKAETGVRGDLMLNTFNKCIYHLSTGFPHAHQYRFNLHKITFDHLWRTDLFTLSSREIVQWKSKRSNFPG